MNTNMPFFITDLDKFANDLQILFDTYGFGQDEREYILKYIYDDKCINYDLLQQVYTVLGVLPEEYSSFKTFYDFLNKYYNLGTNVIDVASGHLPILASFIDKYQTKVGQGSIEAYDPNLLPKEMGNIKIYQDYFDEKIKINDKGLIVGMNTAEALIPSIIHANNYGVDACFLTCNCTALPSDIARRLSAYPRSYILDYWFNYVGEEITKNLPSDKELVVEHLDLGAMRPHPVYMTKSLKIKKP